MAFLHGRKQRRPDQLAGLPQSGSPASASTAVRRKHPRAFADLHEAIRLNPASALSFANRGLAFEMIGDIERAQRDYRIAGQLGMDCSSALRRLAGLAADRSRRSRLAYEPVQEDQDQEDSPPKTPYKLANYSYEEPGGTDDVEADGYGQDAAIAPQPPVLPIGMTSLN